MSKFNSENILSLINIIKKHFQKYTKKDAIENEINTVLSLLKSIPPIMGDFPENDHPVTQVFDAAKKVTSSLTSDINDSLASVYKHLPWRYSYAKRDDAPDLGNNIAFAEIIGPKAPLLSNTVCLGFTLIGPETLYPAHLHPAIELYYVVSGTANWTANNISSLNSPGSYILHPSNVIHSMQTYKDPLLAVYTWSGDDVRTTSAYDSI